MCEEGTPHLTWYCHTTKLSFEWDGAAPVVSVSNGETIPVDNRVGVRNASIKRWMEWFELVCHNYTRLQQEGAST
jgi:RNA polymerase subunit RPABC4/transcription elongation factor Spt4